MKVQFVQSGGFVGAVKGCELDSAALPPDSARELEQLVQGSQLRHSGQFLSDAGRDYQQYDINIEDGDRKVSVTFDDATLPAPVKPLVGLLKKHARPKALI
jgi:hypothetical protein